MDHYQALEKMSELKEEIESLGSEIETLMAEFFPGAHEQGKAYDAFGLTRSWNRYDTTIESLLNECLAELEEEDE